MEDIYCSWLDREVPPNECKPNEGLITCRECLFREKNLRIISKHPPADPIPSRTYNTRQRSKKDYIDGDLDNFITLIKAYSLLIKLEDPTDFEIKLKNSIESKGTQDLRDFINHFLAECDKGDPEDIYSLIVEALGNEAFDEKWFVDGLTGLQCSRGKKSGKKLKAIKIEPHKGLIDYQKHFKEMRKKEALIKKFTYKGLNGKGHKDYTIDTPKKNCNYQDPLSDRVLWIK